MGYREFTLIDLAQGIVTRWRTAVAMFMFTLAVVVIATLVCPKSYTSEAKLFVRLGRENLVLDPTATLGEKSGIAGAPMSRAAELNSIAEMIRSKQLLAGVVDQVGAIRVLKRAKRKTAPTGDAAADAEPAPGMLTSLLGTTLRQLTKLGVLNDLPMEERAVLHLQKKLSVEAVEKSNIVLIRYETHSPEIAQEIVETTLELYLTEHSRLNRTEGAFPFLSDQTAAVQRDLESSENALRELKNSTGILQVEKDREVLLHRLARLTDEVLKAEVLERSVESEVASLIEKLDRLPATTIIESRTGAGNQGADGMRQQMFELEMKKEALAASLTPSHPKVLMIQNQLEGVAELLKQAESGRTEQVMGPNTVYDKTQSELIMKQSEHMAVKSKLATLKTQLASTEAQIQQFTRHEVQYAQLNRKIAVNDASYRKSAQSLLQAQIDDNLKKRLISNISVAQQATLGLKPSFPNKLVNLALGMIFGVLNAVGLVGLLEYRNPQLRAGILAEQFQDVPVMAELDVRDAEQVLVGV